MRTSTRYLSASFLALIACSCGTNDNGAADAEAHGGTTPAAIGGNGTGGRTTARGTSTNVGGNSGRGGSGQDLVGGAGATSSASLGGQLTTGGTATNAAGSAARGGAGASSGATTGGNIASTAGRSGRGGSTANNSGGAAATSGSDPKGGAAGIAGATSRGGTATSQAGRGGTNAHAGTATAGGGTNARGGAAFAGGGSDLRGGASPGGNGTAGSSSPCGESPGQLFGKDHPWNQRIDTSPLDSESATIIAYLQQNHTGSQRFRVDGPSDEPNNLYGITVLTSDASTPRQSFTPTGDFYDPDCDPAPIPIPATGAIEGEDAYACTNDGDCHLIVIDRAECRLYEMWRANRSSASSFDGGCQAVWDLRETYRPELRGDCCTSADAAGLPIAAHMFSADEIAGGRIEHAIRFILPNNLMRSRIYVRPATHSTPSTSGPASAPPYGSRMRLKASFDESQLKPAARVVARALKEYGMILSDGGNLTFTATNDRFTTHKWAEVDFMPSDLTSLQWNDFEVPELGARFTFGNSCDCTRTPIAE
jgi:hypothetical protein